jgi:ligand-binding SRPBCC domain-containing protein
MSGQRFVLERRQEVRRPRADVFAFFADVQNLERITPAFLNFRILTPLPVPMRAGALIDYQLRLYGLPLRWQTRIEEVDPGVSFVDVQVRGPYRYWHHLHEFVDVEGGTEVRDTVHYELPWGPLGDIARALFVRRSLARIFDHRQEVIAQTFDG